MIMQNVGGFMWMLQRWLLAGFFVFAAEKISLQKVTSEIQKSSEIATLYKKTQNLDQDPSSELKPLLEKNQKNLDSIESNFQESANFVRGEIENEATLSQVISYLQLSLLRARSASFHGQWSHVRKDFSSWFLFAADFPYEESSLIGLRTTAVIRSFLLDELERLQSKFSSEMAKDPELLKWVLQLRAPWPVDRVFISEAKRLLKPPMMSVANSAAKAFQKNPYQTSAQALKNVRGGQSEEAKLLKEIWRDSDIQLMKTEINRIGKLQLRFAQAQFQNQFKKPATSIQELLNAHLLERAPMDYFTGKPLDLTSL